MPCNTLMKTIQREVLIFHDHLAMLDTSEELMDTSDKRRIFNSLEENSMAQATIMSFYWLQFIVTTLFLIRLRNLVQSPDSRLDIILFCKLNQQRIDDCQTWSHLLIWHSISFRFPYFHFSMQENIFYLKDDSIQEKIQHFVRSQRAL